MDEDEFNELLKIQRSMASRIIRETAVDDKLKIYDIIKRMVTDKNNQVQTEMVILECQAEGFGENEVIRMMDELKRDHMLVESEVGYVKLS
jgi:hypothetical protein